MQTQKDRYAVLQRKLEHLEKVHADGKKQHQANVDALTKELSTVRKNNADQLTRIDKLKKQVDVQDTKIQDLKRTALADQTEIKDLRTKLRSAEAECAKLKTKSEEAVRTKQALNSTNAARLDELKGQERRIAELEKAVGVEKKRRENVESQLRDAVSAKTAEETRWSTESVKTRSQLEQAQADIAQVRAELDDNRTSSKMEKEELVGQLDCLRDMLGQAATHYGKLVSETVSKATYDRLRREQNSLQFHSFRLERKLANTEAQVAELAGLIRQSQETIDFLECQLRSAEDERSLYRAATLEDFGKDLHIGDDDDNSSHTMLVDTLIAAQKELLFSELEIRESLSSGDRHLTRAYAELNNQLVSSCAAMRTELNAELLNSQMQAIQLQTAKTIHDGTTADLHASRAELEATRKQLGETSDSLDAAKAREIALTQEVKDVKSQSKEQATAHRLALQKEKDTAGRLMTSLQQSKVAEDELRTEIDQLTVELADAERYREAYHNLVDEVGVLAARNELAESEAHRLSQFNAEIVGHNNPAQRIVYLDRVRRELAETKQMLIVATRERDTASAQIESLRDELCLYLSVPAEGKPRTTMTRVGRMPLVAQSQNVHPSAVRSGTGNTDFTAKHLPPVADLSVDMTLDEIS
ncbi:hypothetical protein BJY52DRAFT_1120657 [Lactarius psammicola]|nr:hypothetical protein BJY52DRAFT_1120657 [Lactarius psammicola]